MKGTKMRARLKRRQTSFKEKIEPLIGRSIPEGSFHRPGSNKK